MPEQDGAVLEAIEKLERAAEDLEDAINALPNAEMRAKLKKDLPKLQEVIDNLYEQASG